MTANAPQPVAAPESVFGSGRQSGEDSPRGEVCAQTGVVENLSGLGEADGWSDEFVADILIDLHKSKQRRGHIIKTERTKTALEEIPNRFNLYVQSGNREYLIDVGRYAMAEFIQPSCVPCGMPQKHPGEADHA